MTMTKTPEEILKEVENLHYNYKEYAKEIDQLVYKLYGLTKEEIEIVKKFMKK